MHTQALHSYYDEIFKFIPHLVYWVDTKGHLQGCNENFKQLLHIKDIQKFSKNPYSSLVNHLHLHDKEAKHLSENDKDVMTNGSGKHNVSLKNKSSKESNHYLCDHNPLHDDKGHTIGAITVIMLTENHTNTIKQPLTLDHPPKVLIVEDNPIALKVVTALFHALGCQTDTATSEKKSQALFEPGKYDVVMMDVELEDSNGYAITRNFRDLEKKTDHHVPIIALTSHGAERVKFYSDGKNMDGALTKPLSHQQAEQIIDNFVYQKDVLVSGLKHAGHA